LLKRRLGINDASEVPPYEPRNPFRSICVDYSKCSDDDILRCIVSPQGLCDSIYGLGVCRNGDLIGEISVARQHGTWVLRGMGFGEKPKGDFVAPVYDK
jgi:hypothetical protein